ncbi:MAG: efflux RND transporter permease subunit [Burkholderiales bacterium]
MLQWIIGSSAKYRNLVIAVAVGLLAVGIARVPDITVEALPEFGPVRVEVQTEALGLSPEEAENLITNPMEQEFFTGIPWLHKIRSNSAPGLSAVEMIFEPGTNDVRARQVVQERLTMVPALPAVSKPPFVIQPAATTGRVMIISMSSKDISLVDMSTLARWTIRQRLLSVPGVANVSIWGLRDRQLQVLIDPHRLRLNRIVVEDVIKTAANSMWSSPLTYVEASTPGTGGFIDTANQRISINHTQPIKVAADLAKITIESDSPKPVTLGEVAELVEGHQLLIGDAVVQGGAGLLLVVERSPGSSIAAVTKNVEKALDAMRPGMTGIEFDTTVFRAASFVEAARTNLAGSIGIGLLLVVLTIGALLFNWRAALVSVVAVALSLTAAWMLLSAYGLMLNMMIVAGLVLALAVVVDDAVVGVGNVQRWLAQRETTGGGATAYDSVVAAMKEVGGPLLTALAIVLVSVAPVLVLTEVTADFVKPLALTYALVVAVSMLVALTVTPALAATLMSRGSGNGGGSPLARALSSAYTGVLKGTVQNPAVVLGAAAIIIVGGLAVLPRLFGADLMPTLKDRDIVVRMQAASGTSLPAMTRIATAASKDVRAIPGVRNVGAHIGRATNSDLLSNVDRADLWVSIAASADYNATLAAIERAMQAHPSVNVEVAAYPNKRVSELSTAADDGLVVRVYGRDYEVLRAKAETVAKTIADIPGVMAPQVRLPIVEPTVEVEVNVDKASAKGVKPGDVRRAAATLLSSITAGQLFEQQKIYDVVVWGIASKRGSLTSIQDLLVDAPNDSQVRLGDVAEVRIRPNPAVIKHDAVSRYIDVTARVEGASVAAVNATVEERMKKIGFPSEHHVEVMGESAEREQSARALMFYVLAAALAIFFILQARLNSWRLGALQFVALLVPLSGAALGAATQGGNVSTLSLLGGLAVLGIAVRGGLLLFERCQRIEREEGMVFGTDLVLRAAQDRFDATMLSAVAGVVTLLPIFVYGTVAGLEIVKPMAAMVIGGLLASALANLLVLPALYLRFGAPMEAVGGARPVQLATP